MQYDKTTDIEVEEIEGFEPESSPEAEIILRIIDEDGHLIRLHMDEIHLQDIVADALEAGFLDKISALPNHVILKARIRPPESP